VQRKPSIGTHTFAPAKLFHGLCGLSFVGHLWDIGLLTDERQLTNDLADCDCIISLFCCLHCMMTFELVHSFMCTGSCMPCQQPPVEDSQMRLQQHGLYIYE